jgi:hypothetical protein
MSRLVHLPGTLHNAATVPFLERLDMFLHVLDQRDLTAAIQSDIIIVNKQ